MKTFATKRKRLAPALRKARPYVHQPMGAVQLAQQAEIRRMLRSNGAQAKLTIGQPNDKYEQEADRVAERVMAMPDPKLQRQSENEEEKEMLQTKTLADQITPLVQRQEEPEEEEETLQAKPLADQITPLVQRQEEPEEEEELQAKTLAGQITPLVQRQAEPPEEEEEIQAKKDGGSGSAATTSVESGINNIRRGGSVLSQSTRSFFEPRFGRDFSDVRVHTDANANHLARSINSKAFTVGQDVVFGAGQYSPGSRIGRSLLAHELTHVVQQSHSRSARIMRSVRYSSRWKYGYRRRDATVLYGKRRAPNLVPASGFSQQTTRFRRFAKRWTDGLGIARLNRLGGDCGLYARELISRTGRTPRSYGTTRPGIGLARTNDLRPGEAYYIRPRGTGAGGVVENILSPWNNTVTVRKHLTNFHVATVVAKDGRTAITSEVNAAFPGRVRPWFSMYRGNRGFYRTFKREYRRGGVNPGLWSM